VGSLSQGCFGPESWREKALVANYVQPVCASAILLGPRGQAASCLLDRSRFPEELDLMRYIMHLKVVVSNP